MTSIEASNPTARGNAIIFGHADGDGYLATAVSKSNLTAEGWNVIDTIVDPAITPNYRFWDKQLVKWDFTNIDLVVIVDIAFDFRGPDRSGAALAGSAESHPESQFVVIDHHDLQPHKKTPDNVVLRSTDTVFSCCYGEPNDLMVIASICDKDEDPVRDLITEPHRILARGINRASADRKGVAGPKLMSALENHEWAWLFLLGSESKESHRTFYGNRTKTSAPSPALQMALTRRFPPSVSDH